MPTAAARIPRALLVPMAILAGTLATPSPVDARTYRVRAHPGLDQPSRGAESAVVVAQDSNSAAKDASTQRPAADFPPGRLERPEKSSPASSSRSDAGDPPSERAAAAAERAKRALSEEDGSLFDGGTPVQTELVTTEEPAADSPQPAAKGQPVTAGQVRRTSAQLQAPSRLPGQPSATCIAGCN